MQPTIQDYYNANALIMAFMLCAGGLVLSGLYYAGLAIDKKLGGKIGKALDKAFSKAFGQAKE